MEFRFIALIVRKLARLFRLDFDLCVLVGFLGKFAYAGSCMLTHHLDPTYADLSFFT